MSFLPYFSKSKTTINRTLTSCAIWMITLKDGKEIDRQVAYKSNYPKRAPKYAVNSLATPEDAPSIPEEGGSTGGNDSNVYDEPAQEDNNDFIGNEGGDDQEDFFIPEE